MSIGKRPLSPARRRKLFDWTAFREPSYNAYLVGGLFTMLGLQAPYSYGSLYAIETGVTSSQLGFHVVTVMNAGSVLGRLIPPLMALRTGVFNTFIVSYIAAAIACFSFTVARSSGSILAVAALYGFFSGAVVALSPVSDGR